MALLLSCNRTKVGPRPVIPYVDRLLSDTLSESFQSLSKVNPEDIFGSIAIIGAPEDAVLITEALLTCDARNNITGRRSPDQLPDFAGETIAPLLDRAHAPYDGFFASETEDLLREVTVRNFFFMLDTTCRQRPFDTTLPPVRKPKAKLVILASTACGAYGYDQLDTLCKVAVSSLPVFSALHAMVADADRRSSGAKNLLVWTTKSNAGAEVWKGAAALMADAASTCEAYSPDGGETGLSVRERLLSLLDTYLSEFGSRKISSLLLDDPSVDPAEVDRYLETLKVAEDDLFLPYRNLLAADCVCLTPARSLSTLVYDHMRQTNAFSHRIAYPELAGLFTAPVSGLEEDAYDNSGDFSYHFRYQRAQDRPGADYCPVVLRGRYLPAPLKAFMQERTPKMYSMYVR